jgi:hypothetical protein
MNSYNPFASAFAAAMTELTSDNAKRYYLVRAQQDLQTSFVLILQFACIAYALGQQCRQWMDERVGSASYSNAAPETEYAIVPSFTRTPSIVSDIFVGPTIEVVAVTDCGPLALPPIRYAGLLPAATDDSLLTKTVKDSLSVAAQSLTIRELRKLAKERSIKGYSKLSKAKLLEVLSN